MTTDTEAKTETKPAEMRLSDEEALRALVGATERVASLETQLAAMSSDYDNAISSARSLGKDLGDAQQRIAALEAQVAAHVETEAQLRADLQLQREDARANDELLEAQALRVSGAEARADAAESRVRALETAAERCVRECAAHGCPAARSAKDALAQPAKAEGEAKPLGAYTVTNSECARLMANARREALEEAAELIESIVSNGWIRDRVTKAIRALASDAPKSDDRAVVVTAFGNVNVEVKSPDGHEAWVWAKRIRTLMASDAPKGEAEPIPCPICGSVVPGACVGTRCDAVAKWGDAAPKGEAERENAHGAGRCICDPTSQPWEHDKDCPEYAAPKPPWKCEACGGLGGHTRPDCALNSKPREKAEGRVCGLPMLSSRPGRRCVLPFGHDGGCSGEPAPIPPERQEVAKDSLPRPTGPRPDPTRLAWVMSGMPKVGRLSVDIHVFDELRAEVEGLKAELAEAKRLYLFARMVVHRIRDDGTLDAAGKIRALCVSAMDSLPESPCAALEAKP